MGIWIPIIWKPETFEYQTFLSLYFKWFGTQSLVGLSAMSYVLCTRPTITILDYYIRKQYCVYLSSIQMAFEYQTIWRPTSFQPFWYSYPHCILLEVLVTCPRFCSVLTEKQVSSMSSIYIFECQNLGCDSPRSAITDILYKSVSIDCRVLAADAKSTPSYSLDLHFICK